MSARRPRYRDPVDLAVYEVCPHCRRETTVFLVTCDGHTFSAHRCAAHGDVVPLRSVIRNCYPVFQPLEIPA